MVTRSVRRTLGAVAQVFTLRTKAYLEIDGELVRYHLPEATRRVVNGFDDGTLHVPPEGIIVVLAPPSPHARLGVSHPGTGNGSAHRVPPGLRKASTWVAVRGDIGLGSYRPVPR
jgi:hypothetical protein